LYRQFEYKELDVKPKKKKIKLAGLPGHDEPEPPKTLLEIAHEKLLVKQKEEPKAPPKPKKLVAQQTMESVINPHPIPER
jgi:hypothetical protein